MAEADSRFADAAVTECVRIIHSKWPKRPRAAVILGTGLGGLTSHIEIEATFAYADLPSFPQPTAIAHEGRLVCGELAGVPIVAFQGRVHYYEQFSFREITHPVRVAAALGCQLVIVSNASGGLNPLYSSGDIMVVEDHIDLMGLRNAFALTQNSATARSKQPALYDQELATLAQGIGRRENFACHRGVYVAVTGPNYETRAEYRFMRRIGGDVVGMSTVPEVIAAAASGMRVLALSVVTNVAKPDSPDAVDAMEVVDIAEHAEPKLRAVTIGVVRRACRDA
ncbi:MAG: purine-nucleoside phosphorylase [Planctomycetaceae bacterium]|nr:purine-nucleoside phosphorylase [Planctomycetales bacterium]MCB9875406.1 purine-nucleoside phosphorylase [Planctomycetaceae bacterium]MCB9939355.1 purine-nucleoside phosphorylase [Planctomycetaceae bacterium]